MVVGLEDPTWLNQLSIGGCRLRTEMAADPEYWQKLVQKYFVDNQHRVTLHMTPNSEFNTELEAKESTRLAALQVQ